MMNANAVEITKNFLELLATRDLAAATSYLSDDAVMIFPGNNTFTKLTDFAEWAKSRYQSIEKSIEGFDTVSRTDSTSIVYCYGKLKGRWTDGNSFQDIRFIDRFVIKAGKIHHQEVWNDLAESQSE